MNSDKDKSDKSTPSQNCLETERKRSSRICRKSMMSEKMHLFKATNTGTGNLQRRSCKYK